MTLPGHTVSHWQEPVLDASQLLIQFFNSCTPLSARKEAMGASGRKPEAESDIQQPTNILIRD